MRGATIRRALLLVLALAIPTEAIVIRHDRSDELYRDLAQHYPMVCRIAQGNGTLIHPSWVMTAAHIADALPRKGATVEFGSQAVAVDEIAIHPGYAVYGEHRDMALLKLADPVNHIIPARLHRADDELGQRIVCVGDGETGTGDTGPRKGERVYRAAHNTVDSVADGWLVITFDAPPAGESLEGISGPGDRGGPALVTHGDTVYIIGVSAYSSGAPRCTYGTREIYTRVSSELAWIDGIIGGKIEVEGKPRLMRLDRDAKGKPTASRDEVEFVDILDQANTTFYDVLKALDRAFSDESVEQYLDLFAEDYRLRQEQRGDPLEGLFQFMLGVYQGRGRIHGFHEPSPQGVVIKESAFPMRPVTFHLKDGTSGYFGLALDTDGKIDHLSLFVMATICPDGKKCKDVRKLKDLIKAARK